MGRLFTVVRGAAREKVRVAHALGDLPKISAAMSRGELGYSKVCALTRVANSETRTTCSPSPCTAPYQHLMAPIK